MRGAALWKIEKGVSSRGDLHSRLSGLVHCLRRFDSKAHSSPHTQSSAIVRLSLKVINRWPLAWSEYYNHLREIKASTLLLILHISWETTYNWAFIVFVSSHFDQRAQHVSFRLYKQCVDLWWAQLHLRLASSSKNSISLLPHLLFLFFQIFFFFFLSFLLNFVYFDFLS